jgi:SnoaL-like domain
VLFVPWESMANTNALIAQVYSAFNRRNIDEALALMSENVDWPKASEDGRVVGKEEIRAYWTRQWAEEKIISHVIARPKAVRRDSF